MTYFFFPHQSRHPRSSSLMPAAVTSLYWTSLALLGTVSLGTVSTVLFLTPFRSAIALPPPEDTPEEVLRTEIILDARSPVDGAPLTASEYAALQEELATSDFPPSINSETQHLIFLIQVRKVLNMVLPFQVF